MTGILFDLDGTLLDTLDDLADSVNEALRRNGFPPRTREEVRRFVGNGAAMLVARCVEGECQKVLADFLRLYRENCRHGTAPYKNIPEALAVLAKTRPVAIVSNKPDAAVKALCAEFFPGIYARGESADCPRKPAPDMVRLTMEALGVERCVYVGDSEVDVETARNAGVPCLSVLWGFRDAETLRRAGAVHFCAAPANLPADLEPLLRMEDANGK